MTMTQEWADAFAREWIDAWNAHDLGRVLSHYSDDFEMSSPFIARFTGESSGSLIGKARVGAYWQAALERIPDLHFDLQEVRVGASSVVILYHASFGQEAAEVLFLNPEGLVYRAAAHYGQPPRPAG